MAQKIDFVVLWVDGADPDWQRQRARYAPETTDNGSDPNRFRDWDLMRHWFRCVERFAPWVNRVYFVTNGQVPIWLNPDHPKLKLVKHSDYIPAEFFVSQEQFPFSPLFAAVPTAVIITIQVCDQPMIGRQLR